MKSSYTYVYCTHELSCADVYYIATVFTDMNEQLCFLAERGLCRLEFPVLPSVFFDSRIGN